ncbi:MAG: putative ABC transporter permease [Clostridium sp.]|uniref:putative ABC transporter permease n=1 Tax=Clostridium TaxID=1485 RepID=UPI0021536740|nr:putative ABC transporter permease [Clostridium sp. LY3-2]MCR6515174.1 putative ABC transporter permease [Clostridium sp. LY3-2]
MNVSILILAFTLYSFLGWIVEVTYQRFKLKKFINRGFLHGPFCPIYGVCVLTLVLSLRNFTDNLIVLFIVATILTSLIEYVTSYVLEKFFNDKWWDYTDDPLNLNGRICFHFSLGWGLASVFIIKIVNPIIMEFIHNFDDTTITILAIIACGYFFIDFLITLLNQLKEKKNFKFFNVEKFKRLYTK